MQDRKLYTAKQISEKEIFGPKEIITPYKITQNWVKNGLKFVRGTGKQMLFKLEWIDEYLKKEAEENVLKHKRDLRKDIKNVFVH